MQLLKKSPSLDVVKGSFASTESFQLFPLLASQSPQANETNRQTNNQSITFDFCSYKCRDESARVLKECQKAYTVLVYSYPLLCLQSAFDAIYSVLVSSEYITSEKNGCAEKKMLQTCIRWIDINKNQNLL